MRVRFTAVNVTFVLPSGDEVKVKGQKGDSLLDVAHEHDIDIEGACTHLRGVEVPPLPQRAVTRLCALAFR